MATRQKSSLLQSAISGVQLVEDLARATAISRGDLVLRCIVLYGGLPEPVVGPLQRFLFEGSPAQDWLWRVLMAVWHLYNKQVTTGRELFRRAIGEAPDSVRLDLITVYGCAGVYLGIRSMMYEAVLWAMREAKRVAAPLPLRIVFTEIEWLSAAYGPDAGLRKLMDVHHLMEDDWEKEKWHATKARLEFLSAIKP